MDNSVDPAVTRIQVVRLVAVIIAMSLLSRLMVEGPASIRISDGVWLPRLTTLGVALTGPIASRFLPYISADATMVLMTWAPR